MSSLLTSLPALEPRKLRILMLHGYTQSGPLFHAKTRALEKSLNKAFPAAQPSPSTTNTSIPSSYTASFNASAELHSNRKSTLTSPDILPLYPGGIELIYPSGPCRLSPSQIPGYDAAKAGSSAGPGGTEPQNEIDIRAWWTRNDRTSEYDGLEDGLEAIALAIRDSGPEGIDGVIGFSQGGAAAAFVASLLEPGRVEAFAASESSLESPPLPNTKVHGFRYPSSFLSSPSPTLSPSSPSIFQPPLKFFVSYSGFSAPSSLYCAFYNPPVSTPSLHFIGSLDTVVHESHSLTLAEKCVDAKIVYHPGGHFVPVSRDYTRALVGFIKSCCSTESNRDIGGGETRREREIGVDML